MTPSPVLWGQEKFRDRNNASTGFGKWFARIGHDSVRELPYSLRVDGRQTYIVGYAYTQTGTQEPTVGTDWYPVDLDVFDNQEYASVDAFIASEDGQATLQGCGVSALVPVATAIQRLADNGINITVHDDQLYYLGDVFAAVNKQGQMLIRTGGSQFLRITEDDGTQYASWQNIGQLQESYISQHGFCSPDSFTDTSVIYDGRTYSFSGAAPVINPQLPNYSE